jgi:GxxExxY protein
MSLTESIVEDAALTWFRELGYEVGHGPQMAPGEPAAERDSFGDVLLVGRLREALRQLNPAIHQFRTLATLRDTLLPKLLSGELSVTEMQDSRGGAENAEGEAMKELDDITGAIVDAAMKLHMELGPGLLESVYEVVLARALEKRGFRVERQKVIRFEYDGMSFEEGFRTDLLVEGRVVVELKSVEKLAPVHSKQVLTYLRLMNLPVGLLINFGAATLKEGLHRIVNNLQPSASPRLRVNP